MAFPPCGRSNDPRSFYQPASSAPPPSLLHHLDQIRQTPRLARGRHDRYKSKVCARTNFDTRAFAPRGPCEMLDGRAIIRARALLYRDEVGHDACGIGGVAAREGRPSHEVIKKALLALKNLEHRGGICGQRGDGAGLTCQTPQSFLKEQAHKLGLAPARSLRPQDRLAAGVFFFMRDAGV